MVPVRGHRYVAAPGRMPTSQLAAAAHLSHGPSRKNLPRQIEETYRSVVDSLTEMVCRFRMDGTILFVNAAYAKARGTTPEVLTGTNFWHFVPEEDRQAVRAMLDRLTPGALVAVALW